MTSIDLKLIAQNIKKSGFVLEHEVTEMMRSHQWSVINNRYYVDDVQESAREIDLVAYKVLKVENYYIYTTLIVSCKKSEENAWALLLRDRLEDDPNMEWHPIKVWSNNKVAKYMLDKTQWRPSYITSTKQHSIYGELFEPSGHLFAFQEISKTKSTIQNDKNIFAAVSSLMKAEDYEMNSLERRKKDISLYNFNLVSIVDSELVNLTFKGKNVTPSEIEEAKCIFNYIVNRRDTSSRIHFCRFQGFDKVLSSYDKLHEMNLSYFPTLINSFYDNIFSDMHRVQLLNKDFEREVLWRCNYHAKYHHKSNKETSSISFYLPSASSTLQINVSYEPEVIKGLNKNDSILSLTKRALSRIYRYDGDFEFVEDEIPF